MGRIANIGISLLVMVPIFILLLVSAIITSIVAAKIHGLKNSKNDLGSEYKMITSITIILWIMFGLSVLFSMFIPGLATFPTIFLMFMIPVCVAYITLSGCFFYVAVKVKDTPKYKSGDKTAKMVYKELVGLGVAMLLTSVLSITFTIWSEWYYEKKLGGLKGDAVIASKLAPIVAPEFAPVAAAAGGMAEENMTKEQVASANKNADLGNKYIGYAQKLEKYV